MLGTDTDVVPSETKLTREQRLAYRRGLVEKRIYRFKKDTKKRQVMLHLPEQIAILLEEYAMWSCVTRNDVIILAIADFLVRNHDSNDYKTVTKYLKPLKRAARSMMTKAKNKHGE